MFFSNLERLSRQCNDAEGEVLIKVTRAWYCIRSTVLTRGLDFVDVLQQLLTLVDDIEGEVVHGQGFIRVVLQSLLGQRQVLGIKIIHLPCQLLIP